MEPMSVDLRAHGARPRGLGRSPVPLRPDGDGEPLICVHPAGGGVFCYQDLARSPELAFPVYALQAEGLEPGERPLEGIDALAAEYLERARPLHGAGGWRLCGWSFGGLVAYEMACQLADAGEDVEILAMLDPPIRTGSDEPATDEIGVLADFLEYFAAISDREPAMRREEVAALDPAVRRSRVLSSMRSASLLPPGAGEERLSRMLDVFSCNRHAMVAYRPRPYRGAALLFVTAQPGKARAAGEQWARLCHGGLRIIEMPCAHVEVILRPHVAAVTAELIRLAGSAE
ncbi:alpha/beta fold hydrolase [Nonomuraea sp. NPDC049400]|uniref:thioesterase domain-containing protein n=1 Tax=Nonomuraea sp. NPDC049400 TaxID=3364352 RepID=UPI00378F09A8